MTPSTQPRRVQRPGQILLGLLWLIDAVLQYQPNMFHRSFVTDVILPNADGQPGVIASPLIWIAHQIEPRVALFNALAATLQLLIALGLLAGRRFVRPALAVSFAWAAGIWFAGEGLGGFFDGGANPLTGAPGAALLYIVAGLIVWPRTDGRQLGALGARGAQAAWAAFWLSSAVLWLLPANDGANSVHDAIANAPSGAGWLTSLLNSAASATTGHGGAIALVMAALSAGLAASIVTGVATRISLLSGIAMSLVFWVVGQGLGGIFTGSATDVSTAPLVILIGALLLAAEPALVSAPLVAFRMNIHSGLRGARRAMESS